MFETSTILIPPPPSPTNKVLLSLDSYTPSVGFDYEEHGTLPIKIGSKGLLLISYINNPFLAAATYTYLLSDDILTLQGVFSTCSISKFTKNDYSALNKLGKSTDKFGY